MNLCLFLYYALGVIFKKYIMINSFNLGSKLLTLKPPNKILKQIQYSA